MKKLLLFIAVAAISASAHAQTNGTLYLSYKDTFGTKTNQVVAIWVESSAGAFVKTLRRNVGTGTNDHLNTFNVKSGGSSCTTSGGCSPLTGNVVNAVTGTTLKSTTLATLGYKGFGVKNNIAIWDGTNAAGTLMPDGVYNVWIEAASNDNTAKHEVLTSFSFNKQPASELITQPIPAVVGPAGTGPVCMFTYSNIITDWVTTVDVTEASLKPQLNAYPNPSTGMVTVSTFQANNIKVTNTIGEVIYDQNIDINTVSSQFDLSNFANGLYVVTVTNENGATSQKVLLDK